MIRKITFSLLLAGINLFSGFASAAVCESKTLLVYSNGIFNEELEARASLIVLRHRLNAYPQAAELLPFEYILAYASENQVNNDGTVSESLLQRLKYTYQVELQLQSNTEEASMLWRMIAGDAAIPAIRDEMLRTAAETNLLGYVADTDLATQLNEIYRPALDAGKRVLTVAHSQGNFYANAAYDQLLLDGRVGPASNHMGIVAVASVASFVNGNQGNSHYVTAWEDLAVALRNQWYPGQALPPNSSNFGDINTDDPIGHNFVKYYLAGTNTSAAILNHIVTVIGVLQYPPLPEICLIGQAVDSPMAIYDSSPYLIHRPWIRATGTGACFDEGTQQFIKVSGALLSETPRNIYVDVVYIGSSGAVKASNSLSINGLSEPTLMCTSYGALLGGRYELHESGGTISVVDRGVGLEDNLGNGNVYVPDAPYARLNISNASVPWVPESANVYRRLVLYARTGSATTYLCGEQGTLCSDHDVFFQWHEERVVDGIYSATPVGQVHSAGYVFRLIDVATGMVTFSEWWDKNSGTIAANSDPFRLSYDTLASEITSLADGIIPLGPWPAGSSTTYFVSSAQSETQYYQLFWFLSESAHLYIFEPNDVSMSSWTLTDTGSLIFTGGTFRSSGGTFQTWNRPDVFVKPNVEQRLMGTRSSLPFDNRAKVIDGDFIWRTLDRAPLAQPLLPEPAPILMP